MNKSKLEKESAQWTKKGIITEEQRDQILAKYERTNTSIVLISFAVLFVSIGILLFAFSDWSAVSPLIRIIMLTIVMIVLYLSGYLLFEKNMPKYGISFVVLGYMFFGATLSLISSAYQVPNFTDYQFIIWAIVGLGLVYLYRQPSLLAAGLLVVIIGQWIIIDGLSLTSFVLLAIYLFGYFHFVFHLPNRWTNIIFSLGLISHTMAYMMELNLDYYWFIPMILIIYIISLILPVSSLKNILLYISLIAIFIVHFFEVIFLVDFDANHYYLPLEQSFIIFLIITTIAFLIIIFLTKAHFHWANILLFFPFIVIDLPAFFILVVMFIVALYWIMITYKQSMNDYIPLSMTIFIISTLAAYIQYGWNTMDRSLFFIIGGILLFLISYVFERQRRKFEKESE